MAQQINLYNAAFRKEKKHFAAARMGQALAALCVGAALMYAWQVYQNRRLDQVAQQTDRQLTVLRERMVGLSKEIGLQSRAEELARAEERLRSRLGVLAELQSGAGGSVQGFSPYLAALARRTTDGVWLTGVTIGGTGSDIVLRGRVLDGEQVPAYIRNLNREEPFAGRVVSELKLAARDGTQEGPRRFVEFSMSMSLRGPS
jgi:hypothetical protein